MRARSYSSSFYAAQSPGSLASAEAVIPHIVRLFDPHSIVDVGCGVWTWLSVAMRHGVTDVLGIDRRDADIHAAYWSGDLERLGCALADRERFARDAFTAFRRESGDSR
jgi:2-polyprenyl-3-methyl-5-hydroxy-6-metoxy-1,4-benzoquinol methylase